MFQATRRRLALWYTIITAVLLLLFASGFYLYVRSTLIERVDDTLNHVVEVVERSLVIEPIAPSSDPYDEVSKLRVNVEASFRNNADAVEDDHIDLEWFSPSKTLLWSTLTEPLDIPLRPNRNGETVQVVRGQGGETSSGGEVKSTQPGLGGMSLLLRQVTEQVEVRGQVLGYLRVSHPWFEVTKPTRQLILDLSLGTGLMVMAVGAIGWLLSGLAIEPVRESYQRLKQFTADASHELRNPIATIQTNVQVALSDPDPDPLTQQAQLKIVERLTRRLGRLVDDLLFLARQDSGIVQLRSVPIALDELLRDVVEEQQAIALEKGISLSLKPLEFVPETMANHQPNANWECQPIFTLQGDRDQLARLFTNLVSNAVQYTPAEGTVQVELQRSGRANASQIQVRVQDTGIGIPPEAVPNLFDRFYRVDPARSRSIALTANPSHRVTTGSGLGLAIVQAIVENHQGQITVESQLHQGTTFTVTLPCNS